MRKKYSTDLQLASSEVSNVAVEDNPMLTGYINTGCLLVNGANHTFTIIIAIGWIFEAAHFWMKFGSCCMCLMTFPSPFTKLLKLL